MGTTRGFEPERSLFLLPVAELLATGHCMKRKLGTKRRLTAKCHHGLPGPYVTGPAEVANRKDSVRSRDFQRTMGRPVHKNCFKPVAVHCRPVTPRMQRSVIGRIGANAPRRVVPQTRPARGRFWPFAVRGERASLPTWPRQDLVLITYLVRSMTVSGMTGRIGVTAPAPVGVARGHETDLFAECPVMVEHLAKPRTKRRLTSATCRSVMKTTALTASLVRGPIGECALPRAVEESLSGTGPSCRMPTSVERNLLGRLARRGFATRTWTVKRR